jgi:hypothetical protein
MKSTPSRAFPAADFTAAYYGLFGRRIFDDFETRFLKKNVQKDLSWKPSTWGTGSGFPPANSGAAI